MEYLKQAELYAESQGDLQLFKGLYAELRQDMSVKDSVWHVLSYLYGPYAADDLSLNSSDTNYEQGE